MQYLILFFSLLGASAASDPNIQVIPTLSGVPVMHAAVLPDGNVIFLDKIENRSQLHLSDGRKAYSAVMDPNFDLFSVAPVEVYSNAFCSGGGFLADGRLISVGGNGELLHVDPSIGNGFDGIRIYDWLEEDVEPGWTEPAAWIETANNKLDSRRWYPSVQTMPNGSVFVASGSLNGLDQTNFANNNPTYELLDHEGFSSTASIPMDILSRNQPYFMYPFIHLLKDGSLFIFVSKSAQIFDVWSNQIVKDLPDLPGMYRTYPNTGGSVMLPLRSDND